MAPPPKPRGNGKDAHVTAAIDWLILTAANRSQARGYEAQLAARAADGRLANVRNWLVVPDPKDRRVGSGGSTFVVLHELARRLRGSSFTNQRILLIHSGGDSRRLPAYAAEGKVFVPVPHTLDSGHPATLFDLILADLTPLVRPGRILIATGDVLLGVAMHNPDLSSPGMVGVTFLGAPQVGARHGVYVCDKAGRITDFLQKPDLATARRRKALHRGQLLIDTGILSLDSAAAAQWTHASTRIVGQYRAGRGDPIDLYSDMLPALYGRDSSKKGFSRYRLPFRAAIVPPCEFLHIGSTRELLAVSTTMGSARHRAVTLNSVVSAPLSQHPTSFIESSRITHRTSLGNHAMLVGFPGGFPLNINDHLGMVFLPIGRSDWTCIVFGVKDDFKTPFGRGGTMFNALVHLTTSTGASPADPERLTLWDARCWVVGSLRWVLKHTPGYAAYQAFDPGERIRGWSLAQLMPRVNIARLLEHRRALLAESNGHQALTALQTENVPPAHIALAATSAQRHALLKLTSSRIRKEQRPFTLARLHRLAALLDPTRASSHDAQAFARIADGVAGSASNPPTTVLAAITPGQVVTVTAPVRIDLCGGWSDTPPICHELGGAVVNAAVTLNGEHPIRVTARLIDEPILHLSSDDLSKSLFITTTRDALSHHDPHDWAALPKAALILSGITPNDQRRNLRARLAAFGGGVELTMSVAVPKGSGLGTSSILGAAVLACLDRLCGRRSTTRSLIARTSILEQMMSTAGGWQDQAGGVTPGIKILRTRSGPDQVPRLTHISVPPAAMRDLAARSLLYYTGQRRLARDILHGVVRRYLSGDPAAIRIIHDLKAAAEQMARHLSRGDIDLFARGILRNWELKKAIDPGATNAAIERMLAPLTPHLSGYELAGAGGGGFIFMVARSAQDAQRLRRTLSRTRGPARLVAFGFDARGLSISVEP